MRSTQCPIALFGRLIAPNILLTLLWHSHPCLQSPGQRHLKTQGWCAIFNALRDNKANKIESWDLSQQRINPEIAKALAEYVSVSTTITSLKCAAAWHSFRTR